jgi:hypothetical protein
MANGIRPESTVPQTASTLTRDQINADVAHEGTLRYFIEQTELGVLTKEQMALMSLCKAYNEVGFDMSPVLGFFEAQRQYSSGEDGRGRIQAKEAITTSTVNLPWMYGNEQGGFWQGIKDFITRKPSNPQPQQGR